MKINTSKRNNIIFLIVIAVFLIPQTRKPIQVLLHKGLALISPSVINNEETSVYVDYNWKLKEENGTVLNFETIKGKVVLVNFWATWCPPCIAEMPSIQKLYDDYKDKITFVFVSNENWSIIDDFYIKNSYNLPTYNTFSKVPGQLKSNSIPATFIIDKKGNIVTDKKGAANWNSTKVRKLLDELIK